MVVKNGRSSWRGLDDLRRYPTYLCQSQATSIRSTSIQRISNLEIETSPYASPAAKARSPIGGLNEMTIAKNWLIFFLVATFGGAVAGMFAGGIIGAILGAMGSPMQSIQIASGIAGFVAGLPVSYLAYRWRVKRMLCDVSGDTFA